MSTTASLARSLTCGKYRRSPVANRLGRRYAPSPAAAFAAVPGGGVVLHMATKRYYSMNETGAAIWDGIAAGRDRAAIVEHLAVEYDIAVHAAESAFERIAAELLAEGLITPVEDAASPS
jgi:hypothetical protein